MKKILFIYQQLSLKTGGGVFTNVIRRSLSNIGVEVVEFSYPEYSGGWDKLRNQLRMYSAGMNHKYAQEIIDVISNNSFDIIIFNGSQLGKVAKRVKRDFSSIKTFTIFHNLEYKFVLDAFKINKNPAQLLTLLSTYVNEKDAILYSDAVATLNERDSDAICALYHHKADCILPLCIEDRFDEKRLIRPEREKIGAFVGSKFFANSKGIKWFCENVSNRINCKILVIGKGFEEDADYFGRFPNIELIGTVDSIDEYYYKVDFIVSPIFDGSGMKTKTAEALMFGKNIFATSEAFEGYDIDYKEVGALCNNAEEFVNAINSYNTNAERFNSYSRRAYETKYSQIVFTEKLKKVISDLSYLST